MPKKEDTAEVEPKENLTPKQPEEPAVAAPSLEGLVKMQKDDRVIHAHPTTLADHKKNGWKTV